MGLLYWISCRTSPPSGCFPIRCGFRSNMRKTASELETAGWKDMKNILRQFVFSEKIAPGDWEGPQIPERGYLSRFLRLLWDELARAGRRKAEWRRSLSGATQRASADARASM